MLGTSLELGARHHLDTDRYLKASIGTTYYFRRPKVELCKLDNFFNLTSLLSQKQFSRVFRLPDTASHARCGPLATVTRVLSSARVLLNWRVKRTRSSVQCSVFSVQCPGVERAVNTGRGNVPDRPDTRRGHGDWNLICYSLKHN